MTKRKIISIILLVVEIIYFVLFVIMSEAPYAKAWDVFMNCGLGEALDFLFFSGEKDIDSMVPTIGGIMSGVIYASLLDVLVNWIEPEPDEIIGGEFISSVIRGVHGIMLSFWTCQLWPRVTTPIYGFLTSDQSNEIFNNLPLFIQYIIGGIVIISIFVVIAIAIISLIDDVMHLVVSLKIPTISLLVFCLAMSELIKRATANIAAGTASGFDNLVLKFNDFVNAGSNTYLPTFLIIIFLLFYFGVKRDEELNFWSLLKDKISGLI